MLLDIARSWALQAAQAGAAIGPSARSSAYPRESRRRSFPVGASISRPTGNPAAVSPAGRIRLARPAQLPSALLLPTTVRIGTLAPPTSIVGLSPSGGGAARGAGKPIALQTCASKCDRY